jgi:serine/threonine-protein kinase
MYTIASDEPVLSPRKFLPDYPPTLEAVLLKALAKDQKQRYATASEFQRALDQCLPVAERANTDEDIGNFMRKLFGNKREESRAALAEALALADQHGSRGENPGTPLKPPHANKTLSEVGLSSAQRHADSTFSTVHAPFAAERRRRIIVVSIVGTLLALGAGVFAMEQMGVFGDAPAPVTSASAEVKPKPPAPPPSPAVDLQALPVEPSAAGSASAAAPRPTATQARPAPAPVPVAAPPAPVPTIAAPAASATAKPAVKPPAPKWRQDPGF